MPGISITRVGIGLGTSGGWNPPFKSDALFGLDGNIITVGADKYFRDKTGNGRHFLITGYDFDSTWNKGFPYKSVATISAPAGDAVLIAADINSYLYTTGTPNAIPVVSLFQDIDYEHKIFCKHAAQVLDGNGIETYEPRVLEIVMYNTVKATTELTTCQTYYGVPAESGTALWVDKTGNDGNLGTEASPYLTIAKAISVGNGKVTYVRTGDYLQALIGNNQLSIIGIGRSSITKNYPIITNASGSELIIKGFIATGAGGDNLRITADSTTTLYEKIKCTGNTFGVRVDTSTVTSLTYKDSYFDNYIYIISSDAIFDSCLIAMPAPAYIQSTGRKLTFNNCKFTEVGSTGILQALAASSEFELNGCDYFGNTYVDESNAYAPTISILRSKIKVKAAAILSYVNNTGSRTIKVNNNTITSVAAFDQLFNCIGKGTTEIKDNTITGTSRDFTAILSGKDAASNVEFSGNTIQSTTFILTSKNCNSVIKNNVFNTNGNQIITTVDIALVAITTNIENNVINSQTGTISCVLIGTEGSSASDNLLNGSVLQKNKSLKARYYDSDPGSQHWLLCYAQTIEAKYNYLNGTFLGYVMKSNGGTNASVVRHNIIVDTDNPFLSKGCKEVKYYNNTAIYKKATGSTVGLVIMTETNPSEDTEFKNNIICDYRAGSQTSFISSDAANLHGALIDYNIYYSKDGDYSHFFHEYGTNNYSTFAEWQALGHDAHSIILTDAQALALFTDYANDDYSLAAGGLAIGSGVNLGAAYDDGLDSSTDWGTDLELPVVVTKQQSAAWDIGAYIH